ncbi:MAG: hypothetical protein HQL75_00380 [Magnetococcales bacterium]|nr:hypothetical protein [Magnetococcales bacterium]
MVALEDITNQQRDALKELFFDQTLEENLIDVFQLPISDRYIDHGAAEAIERSGIVQSWMVWIDYIGREAYAINPDGKVTIID